MGALPAEVNTMSPVPSSASRCLPPPCPSGLLIILMPWGSTGAVYTQSQALGQIRPNASLHVLADSFYPQDSPSSQEGVQGLHGREARVPLQPHSGWGNAGISVP